MKQSNLLLAFILFCFSSISGLSQTPTHLENTFSGTQLSKGISIIYDNKALLTEGNGALKVAMSKDSAYHLFLYQFDTIDISKNPYVNFKLKTNTHTEFYVGLIQDSMSSTPPSYFVVNKDSVYNNYYFDFTDLLTFQGQKGTITINAKKITGVYFLFANTSKDSLVADIDDFKIGSSVTKAAVVTGYEDDFNDNIVSKRWVSERKLTAPFDFPYLLSEDGSSLKVNTYKENWNGLWVYPESLLDISENPIISIRAKATRDVTFTIFLWDNKNNYLPSQVDIKITKSDVLKTYYFNFTNKFGDSNNPLDNLDPKKIKALLINFNPGGLYKGVVTLDEIKIGDKAPVIVNAAPTISSIPDIYLKPNAGAQSITLRGITFGNTLGYQEVYLDAYTDNNNVIQDQMYIYSLGGDSARLEFSPAKNTTGTTIVTIRVSDNGGTAHGGVDTTLMSFKVIVMPTGVKDASEVKDILIYPSPVQNELFIDSEKPITNIMLKDMYGRELMHNGSISTFSTKVELSGISPGIYILRIDRGDEMIQKKILK